MRFSTTAIFAFVLVLPALAAPIEISGAELGTVAESIGSETKSVVASGESKIGASSDEADGLSSCSTGSVARRGLCSAVKNLLGVGSSKLDAEVQPLKAEIAQLPALHQPYANAWLNDFIGMSKLSSKLDTDSKDFIAVQLKMNTFVKDARARMVKTSASGPPTWQWTGHFEQDIPNVITDIEKLSPRDMQELEQTSWKQFDDALNAQLKKSGLGAPKKST